MREGHKHLFWFLLAASAALWGLKQRAFPATSPSGRRSLSETAPKTGTGTTQDTAAHPAATAASAGDLERPSAPRNPP